MNPDSRVDKGDGVMNVEMQCIYCECTWATGSDSEETVCPGCGKKDAVDARKKKHMLSFLEQVPHALVVRKKELRELTVVFEPDQETLIAVPFYFFCVKPDDHMEKHYIPYYEALQIEFLRSEPRCDTEVTSLNLATSTFKETALAHDEINWHCTDVMVQGVFGVKGSLGGPVLAKRNYLTLSINTSWVQERVSEYMYPGEQATDRFRESLVPHLLERAAGVIERLFRVGGAPALIGTTLTAGMFQDLLNSVGWERPLSIVPPSSRCREEELMLAAFNAGAAQFYWSDRWTPVSRSAARSR
ncbi:MAG: hypothetical protein RIC85_00475 [Gammaproteobacteria bacterium]